MEQSANHFSQSKIRFRIAPISNEQNNIRQKERIKLIQIGQRSFTTRKPIRKQIFPKEYQQNDYEFGYQISSLRKDIKQLKKQLGVNNQNRIRVRSNMKTVGRQIEYCNPTTIQKSPRKIMKNRKNKYQFEAYEDQQWLKPINYFPIIEKYTQLKQQYQSKPSSFQIFQRNKSQFINFKQRKFYFYDKHANKRKLRKVLNAVLFTIYLRTYNERMRLQRKSYFGNYFKEKIQSKLLQIKQSLIQYLHPFFLSFIKLDSNFIITKSDNETLVNEKLNAVQQLAKHGIECLHQFTTNIGKMNQFVQTLYYLCKHGNYGCLNGVNSNQQLNLMCISEYYGYMRGDANLQKSAIISLLFVKILLFNILFKPQSISSVFQEPIITNNETNLFKNIQLVGTVLYELFISVQDQLLEQSPSIYVIGNWQKLQHRFNFKPAESMTVKSGFYRKKEVISGLLDHNYIIKTYKTEEMYQSKSAIKQCLQLIRKMIAKHHSKIRYRCFTKSYH